MGANSRYFAPLYQRGDEADLPAIVCLTEGVLPLLTPLVCQLTRYSHLNYQAVTAMTDLFSVTTSSFAAVGLADVVIRVGKELYGFLAAIKGAPTEIRRLQSDLRDLKLIVSEVKLYWEEFNLSSSPANRHDVLHSFVSSLEAVREELFASADLAKTKEGIAKRLAGKIKWVFEEREIAKSLKRLESHKAALNIALILVGR